MVFGDVVNQFENDDRLADACAAEGADFAALGERTDQIDDLDARLENRRLHVLLGELRRLAMNRVALGKRDRTAIVDRVAGHVEDAAERPLAHRNGDRAAGVGHRHAALKAFGGRHRDGADPFFAEMLLHFEGELGRAAVHFILDLERVVDAREFSGVGEVHVDDGTDDLDDITCIHKRSDPRGDGPARGRPKVTKLRRADKGKAEARTRDSSVLKGMAAHSSQRPVAIRDRAEHRSLVDS